MLQFTCSHCKKNTATRVYLYTDTRATREDYPHLVLNPYISVYLCDDCDKLITEADRDTLAFEIFATAAP